MTRRPTYADRRTLGRVMVGRAADLGVLRRLCRSASAGAGGAALVEGVAGAGKTTLLRALVDEVSDLDALWGRAPQEGGTPAYWPWREIASAAGWDVAWQGSTDLWSLGAELTARISQSARVRPMLLLVDDLHAADDDTLRLTAYLASALRDSPVALVVAARPDERLSTIARACEVVDLTPLDRAESDEVIDQHASAPLSAEARSTIRRVAEGNPLVLRELSRTSGSGRLPREVRASVEQRLATLDRPTRQTVDSAAVLGREFDLRDLAALVARSQVEVAALLRPLRDHGLMSNHGVQWSFTHQVVRDAVYEALPESLRLTAHRDAAALYRQSMGHGASVARVAEHLLAALPAADLQEAVAAARAAAREASLGAAPGEAATYLARVLPLVPTGPSRLELLLELGDARLAAGAVHDAVTVFEDAERLALRLDDEPRRARALLGLSARVGTSSVALDHVPALQDAARALSGDGEDALVVSLLSRSATLQAANGRQDRAIADADAALALARETEDPRSLALALSAMHVCTWAPGREAVAADLSRELVEVAAGSGDLDLALEAQVARMVDALRGADLDLLDESLARAAAIAHRSGSPRHEFFVLSRRAMRVLIDGRLGEAASLLARAHEIGIAIEEPDTIQVFWGTQFLVLSELNGPEDLLGFADVLAQWAAQEPGLGVIEANFRAAAGDVESAGVLLRRGLADPGLSVLAATDLALLVLMAIVAVKVGDAEVAAELDDALRPFAGSMAVNAGAVTFCGAVDHWLGLLAAAQGDDERARTLISGAVETYAAMGAAWFQRKAESDLAALEAVRPGRDRATPERRAVLRRVDGGWEAGWADRPATFPDVRGLGHLHALLSSPGSDVHSADLVRPGAAAMVGSQARDALLDETAKRAYRARISALQQQVADAEADGEHDRAGDARDELDVLLHELRRAVGLGGRDRSVPDDAERARVAVRKALTAALTRLSEHDPAFAGHLQRSVRTGLRCSYQPDPVSAVHWTLR